MVAGEIDALNPTERSGVAKGITVWQNGAWKSTIFQRTKTDNVGYEIIDECCCFGQKPEPLATLNPQNVLNVAYGSGQKREFNDYNWLSNFDILSIWVLL